MAPSPLNGVATGASVGCSQDPGAPPSAQCSCGPRVTAILCSSSSKVSAGLRAPRLSPGPLYMPRSVSLVGLARKGGIPQNNSTTECCFCDSVVLGESYESLTNVQSPSWSQASVGAYVPFLKRAITAV